jgi:hypothetical protein
MTRVAAVVFHWLRRARVLERDIFRLGTATTNSLPAQAATNRRRLGA